MRDALFLYLCQQLWIHLLSQFPLDLAGLVHGTGVFVPSVQIEKVQFALHTVQLILELLQ